MRLYDGDKGLVTAFTGLKVLQPFHVDAHNARKELKSVFSCPTSLKKYKSSKKTVTGLRGAGEWLLSVYHPQIFRTTVVQMLYWI